MSNKPTVTISKNLRKVSTLIDPRINVVLTPPQGAENQEIINNELASGDNTRELLRKTYGKGN